jgi:CIC family chloride channel protein
VLKSIQKITNFFEQYFSKLKTVLEPRQFLYISSVLVGLSAALAVIVLKTFAHNVFLFSQYLNKEFHLPYSKSTLPIIGILLTVFVIKNFLTETSKKEPRKLCTQ